MSRKDLTPGLPGQPMTHWQPDYCSGCGQAVEVELVGERWLCYWCKDEALRRNNLEGAARTQSPISGGNARPLPHSPTRPILIDAFCKAGGCTKGYQRAGFYVVGVDIEWQPNYIGDQFIQADALDVLRGLLAGANVAGGWGLKNIAGFHASPPCQADSQTQRIQGNEHPRLIEPMRDLLEATGLPYVIENVPGAPLRDPVELCGAMFPPLKVYRHRLFETNFPLPQPPHVPHVHPQVKMGRAATNGEWLQVVGNFSGVAEAREAMGMPWANRDELREAIPPAYTEWIGRFLMAEVREPQGRLAA